MIVFHQIPQLAESKIKTDVMGKKPYRLPFPQLAFNHSPELRCPGESYHFAVGELTISPPAYNGNPQP